MGLIDRLLDRRERAQAERRWRANNARAKAAGCPCGGPAEVVKEHHDVIGSVPYQWWTCRNCAGATAFSGNRPMWEHKTQCPECGFVGASGKIGQPYEFYYCYHRPGERE